MNSIKTSVKTSRRSFPSSDLKDPEASKITDLDPGSMEKVDFVLYKSPVPLGPSLGPSSCGNGTEGDQTTAEEEWMARTSYIEDDLRWLLRLPHDRFWCQVIHDISLHECITSFLRCAPRPYDLDIQLSPKVKQKDESLLRLFFLVCLRMSTHKESKESHLCPETFGDIIYQNFIFDIPKLMDICVLFGKSNEAIVGKMLTNIFAQQKKYYDDLQVIVSTTVQVFDTISANCGFASDLFSPPKQLKNKEQNHRNQLILMSSEKFRDIILYLLDISCTLRCFFDIFHQGSVFFSRENFPQRLAVFYEAASVGFSEAFQKRNDPDEAMSSEMLKRNLALAKGCFLHIFHKILFHSFIEPLLECVSVESASEYAEGYMNIITGILGEKRFLADLQALFPFEEDEDILKQSVYKIDQTRFQYIEDAIAGSLATFKTSIGTASKCDHDAKQSVASGSSAIKNSLLQNGNQESDPYESLGACAPRVTGVELESLICLVKDLFPELGDEFIRLCLEEYNYDSEKVISALLDNNLSHALQDLDRSLTRPSTNNKGSSDPGVLREALAANEDSKSLLSQRSNVFDGDEFDVFQHNVDISKIHVGKKKRDVDIDNRTELPGLKSFYQKYDQVVDIVEVDDGDYDDEYDDTYDSIAMGTIDDDSADEMTARRPYVTPRIFEKAETKRRIDESSSEDETSLEEKAKQDHFIEDPAKLRELREARYAAHAANRGRGKGHHATSSNPQETHRDVKGGPKGQGQSHEVLRNRAYKERHKDSRVHHNRKDAADRKRQF